MKLYTNGAFWVSRTRRQEAPEHSPAMQILRRQSQNGLGIKFASDGNCAQRTLMHLLEHKTDVDAKTNYVTTALTDSLIVWFVDVL